MLFQAFFYPLHSIHACAVFFSLAAVHRCVSTWWTRVFYYTLSKLDCERKESADSLADIPPLFFSLCIFSLHTSPGQMLLPAFSTSFLFIASTVQPHYEPSNPFPCPSIHDILHATVLKNNASYKPNRFTTSGRVCSSQILSEN